MDHSDPLPAPCRRPGPRTGVPLALLLTSGAALLAAPAPGAAQIDDSPADTVAMEFLRGFQSMAWAGLAQRLHPEALAYLRIAVDIPIQVDTTGWAVANLGGAETREAYAARSDAQVFADVMRWTQTHAQGLLSSLVSREVQYIGLVPEGPDTAHAVYRVTTLAYGAEPTVQVASLVRTDQGWKVREAPEIRVLHTALRGIPIPPRGHP